MTAKELDAAAAAIRNLQHFGRDRPRDLAYVALYVAEAIRLNERSRRANRPNSQRKRVGLSIAEFTSAKFARVGV